LSVEIPVGEIALALTRERLMKGSMSRQAAIRFPASDSDG
jgi:hypothetical protein